MRFAWFWVRSLWLFCSLALCDLLSYVDVVLWRFPMLLVNLGESALYLFRIHL